MTVPNETRMLLVDCPSPDRAPDPPDEAPITVIGPPKGWQLVDFRELWQFRDLVYFLAWRDVKVRYKQTALGAAWAVLQPALMTVVFTLSFGRLAGIATGDIPYPLFVYAGMLAWKFFETAIVSGGNSVIGSERLITKIYFPRLAIPFAAVAAAVVDLVVAFGLLVVMMAYYRMWGPWQMLMLPPLIAIVLLAAAGIGTLLAALNVNYRDFRYVIPFLAQVWMFGTPSIYLDIFDPAHVNATGVTHTLVSLNPMTGLVAGFRAALLGTPMPWEMIGWSAGLAAVVFVLGCFYFRRMEDTFADVI